MLIAFIAVVALRDPNYATWANLNATVYQWAPAGIVAIAVTYVMIAGNLDLSMGGVFGLVTVVVAQLVSDGMPVPIAYVIGILVGATIGSISGICVTKLYVNSFIATFGVGTVCTGLAIATTQGRPIMVGGEAFAILGQHHLGPVPVASVLFIGMLVVGGLILAYTLFGRYVYAVGADTKSARRAGIDTDALQISTFVVSGALSGLAGIVFASRIGQGQGALGGLDLDFQVVTAIVVGGTAIYGGIGNMWRTAMGLAVLAAAQSGINSFDLDPFYTDVFLGTILIAAVAWSEYLRRRARAGLPAAT